MKDTDTLC